MSTVGAGQALRKAFFICSSNSPSHMNLDNLNNYFFKKSCDIIYIMTNYILVKSKAVVHFEFNFHVLSAHHHC